MASFVCHAKVQRQILDWYRYLIFCGLHERFGDRGRHSTAAIQTLDTVLRIVFMCSRSIGSVSGRIQIRNYFLSGSGSGSFHSSHIQQPKKFRKTLFSTVLWLINDFLSLKTDVNVPTERNKHKNLEKKIIFCLLFLNPMTKRAGSGSRSVSIIQCMDPSPSQNVTDRDYWLRIIRLLNSLMLVFRFLRSSVCK